MLTRRLLAAWLALSLLGLGGCSTLPAPPAACRPSWSGRLIAVPGNGRAPLLAGYRLELGADGSGALQLSSPLGSTLAEAGWDRTQAWISSGGLRRDYTDFGAMLGQAIGVALPPQAFAAWMDGRALASAPHTALPTDGFEQLGWRVMPSWDHGQLRRLQLQRVSGPGSLTLVIDSRSSCGAS